MPSSRRTRGVFRPRWRSEPFHKDRGSMSIYLNDFRENPTGATFVLLLILLCAPIVSGAACFELVDRHGTTVYLGGTPPFDFSMPPMSAAYRASQARGEHLIIMRDSCEATRSSRDASFGASSSSLPGAHQLQRSAASERSSGVSSYSRQELSRSSATGGSSGAASSGSQGGSCATPDQLDSRGHRCGGRAASERSGGR